MTEKLNYHKKPCSNCPWRRDVPPGKFPPERFAQLANTVEQGFMPYFACHNSKEVNPVVCAGYLLGEGTNNFTVRVAVIQGRLDLSEISSDVPMFDKYSEMAAANGVYLGSEEE